MAVALWLALPSLPVSQRHSAQEKPLASATVTSAATPPRTEMPSPGIASPQATSVPTPPPATAPASAPPAPSAEPAWLRFAVPAVARDGRARIAIIIDDMGLDRARSERAIALPGPLTLSFLAYARDLPQQTALAHRNGHELMVHVPMEPTGHMLVADPNQLDVAMSREEVLTRLRWDLSRFDGFVGINNHMGSRFTADAPAMRPVLEELKARGLLFIDSRTTPSTAGAEVARELGVPHASRDVFLDYEVSIAAVEQQLTELERVAQRNGSAIAIGHPHDQTLEVLQRWLRELPEKGLVLVPVSAIVRERGTRELARETTGVMK
ncbi:MAG TPA: divergent polysaccharide deacetylase family protein [Stellaceae bacterium]|nr:divergent polysaccharide deacetylase family protein [Stellaceae bacterium]